MTVSLERYSVQYLSVHVKGIDNFIREGIGRQVQNVKKIVLCERDFLTIITYTYIQTYIHMRTQCGKSIGPPHPPIHPHTLSHTHQYLCMYMAFIVSEIAFIAS